MCLVQSVIDVPLVIHGEYLEKTQDPKGEEVYKFQATQPTKS